MKHYKKKDFPVEKIRRFLEPGPIVLVSSSWKNEDNIMTMGWHTVMEFSPSLIGCIISNINHSFELIKKSKQCVINIPAVDMIETIIDIGNTTGSKVDKFSQFKLTKEKGMKVNVPMIKECHTNLECKLIDARLIAKYNFFIFEVVKAHAAITPKYPATIHYTGDGIFMLSGKHVNYKKRFKKDRL